MVLAVDAAAQFPKSDLRVCWTAVSVVELVEAGAAAVLLTNPVNIGDGAAVVELANAPNIRDVLAVVEDAAGTEVVAVVEYAGCPKPPLDVALAKRGLKVGTGGLFSGAVVAVEVVVAPKIGLNIDARGGLALLAGSEVVMVEAGVGAAAEEAVGVASGLASPNRPAVGMVGILLGALVT